MSTTTTTTATGGCYKFRLKWRGGGMNLHMVNALGKGVIRGVKGMGAVVNVTDYQTYRPTVRCLNLKLNCVIG